MPEAALRPALIALAGGLREARTQRGIGLRRLAAMVDLHPSVLSSFELAQRTPPGTTVARILGVLRSPNEMCDQLIDLAGRAHDRGFIDHTGHNDHLLRTACEQRSTRVIEWSPSLISEALQTAEYARALRDTGLLAPDVLRDQLDQLRTWKTRPRIAVRLVPAADCPPGLVEPFTLYECRAGALAVAVRHHHGGVVYSTHQATLTTYEKTAQALQLHATGNTWP